MKHVFICIFLLFTWITFAQDKYVLVIHGGAGSVNKANMSVENQQAYQDALTSSLLAGYEEILKGNSAVDAVEKSIIILENSPLFNAGKGAVFTHEGLNELDASVMFGKTQSAGAVAGVKSIKNPILAARAVMEKSPHVLLSREGAEQFAAEQGLEIVENSYFFSQPAYDAWQRVQKSEKEKSMKSENSDNKFGTVGAVALDFDGNLAAGTSTGGMTNKRWGRIGDSPVIGAGTYANEQVGISSTGWGEFYIRVVAAYDVAAQIKYSKTSLSEAVKNTLASIKELGGNGGMIALDKNGEMTAQYNTQGMFRAAITENGKILIEF
ncbi:MAG: isoaspartyl peptidase/L-asparaginase [Flavobacteriaceae bacterium]|nr:isoaspartyl peptidase/L-asparaginase [Flavobacteriaceae bacterium]